MSNAGIGLVANTYITSMFEGRIYMYIYMYIYIYVYIYTRCACDSVLPYNLYLYKYIYIYTPLRFHHAVQFQAQAFICGTFSPGCRALSRLRINHPPVISIFIGGISTIPKWMVYDKFRTLFYWNRYWNRY